MTDWAAFVVVAISTILGAGTIVLFFSLGIRLRSEAVDPQRQHGRRLLRAASAASYTLAGIAVVYGVYLIVPYFQH